MRSSESIVLMSRSITLVLFLAVVLSAIACQRFDSRHPPDSAPATIAILMLGRYHNDSVLFVYYA